MMSIARLSFGGLLLGLIALPRPGFCDESKLKIGIIVPLSGPIQEFGKAIANGVEMVRADYQPAAFCDWKFEDSKYESKEAVSAFQRLVDREKVNLIYVFGGPITDALAPLAESRKIPLISSETEPRFSIGRKYVIRFNSPSEEFGKRLSEYFVRKHFKNLGLVRTENQYIDGILRGLRAELPKEIKLEELHSFIPADNDFRTTVLQLRAKRYDALGVFLLGYQASTFIKQLEEQKVNFPKFGLDFFESATVIKAAGPQVEEVVFPSNDPSEEFHKEYLSRYGNDAELHWAGFGYDFARLAAEILCNDRSQSGDGESIIKKFQSAGERTGKNGKFRYRETPQGDKYFEFPVVLREVKAGVPKNVR